MFADTGYWVALINPRDNLHQRATEVSQQLGAVRIVTSEMVLTEVLNTFAAWGDYPRNRAATAVLTISQDAAIEVVPQTRRLFNQALQLYLQRPDKGWSLTDCASFTIMNERNITEALTPDHHYIQFGFAALLA